MRSIDTNILARLILNDDPDQEAIALDCISQPIFVPATVMLELGWLLQSRYGMDREATKRSLLDVVGIETVRLANQDMMIWAIERFAEGADLADMIHIISSGEAQAFATFDRKIAKHTGPDSPIPIEVLG